jgi:hypothetical protein
MIHYCKVAYCSLCSLSGLESIGITGETDVTTAFLSKYFLAGFRKFVDLLNLGRVSNSCLQTSKVLDIGDGPKLSKSNDARFRIQKHRLSEQRLSKQWIKYPRRGLSSRIAKQSKEVGFDDIQSIDADEHLARFARQASNLPEFVEAAEEEQEDEQRIAKQSTALQQAWHV